MSTPGVFSLVLADFVVVGREFVVRHGIGEEDGVGRDERRDDDDVEIAVLESPPNPFQDGVGGVVHDGDVDGPPGRSRTCNPVLKRHLRCRLRHGGKWWRGADSNRQPSGNEPAALPLRHPSLWRAVSALGRARSANAATPRIS